MPDNGLKGSIQLIYFLFLISFIYPYIYYLSIYLSIYLSTYLSIYIHMLWFKFSFGAKFFKLVQFSFSFVMHLLP